MPTKCGSYELGVFTEVENVSTSEKPIIRGLRMESGATIPDWSGKK